MRFGSLTNFSHIRKGFSEIGRKLRISEVTVRKLIRTFIRKGYNFERLGHQRIRFAKFSPRLCRVLTN